MGLLDISCNYLAKRCCAFNLNPVCQSRSDSWYQPTVYGSIMGLRAMRLLQGSITLHTNNDVPITSHLQYLIVQCSGNVNGMKVRSVKLEVRGEPIFLKGRVLPYGQREGVLKALQEMEQDGVISKVESSAWATLIVVAMKSNDYGDVQRSPWMPVFFEDRFGGRIPTDSTQCRISLLENNQHAVGNV
ncbi:unnamed protein product [Echinostoma caproni]|uniref:Mediator of RNA polymerase II transcription subunit 20 n=1 Tax=Echinostoma caproni TaxID=27848 RepID=A0A183A993_9TREM|nr:unnamed protein product [Echinostoma caproni]